jgi:hypothetical protein
MIPSNFTRRISHLKQFAAVVERLECGGSFRTAGGISAENIAKWNGSNWSALGLGLEGTGATFRRYVYALAVSGSDLYAAGRFSRAGGSPANYIAKWNGSSWSALGSGINTGVRALAVSGNYLEVGGDFTTAGGKVSACIARAYLPDLPTLSVRRSGADVMVSWPATDTADFVSEQAGTLSVPASRVSNRVPITDNGMKKSVTIPATNSPQFFRLRR